MKPLRILFVAIALVACKKSDQAPAAGEQAATQAIVIGATLPLTGAEARIGGFYKEGYQFAFDEANAAGGLQVGGKRVPVKLVLLDDTSTQATAASLAERLIHQDNAQ